MMVLFVF